jgi:hypothetical protein
MPSVRTPNKKELVASIQCAGVSLHLHTQKPKRWMQDTLTLAQAGRSAQNERRYLAALADCAQTAQHDAMQLQLPWVGHQGSGAYLPFHHNGHTRNCVDAVGWQVHAANHWCACACDGLSTLQLTIRTRHLLAGTTATSFTWSRCLCCNCCCCCCTNIKWGTSKKDSTTATLSSARLLHAATA